MAEVVLAERDGAVGIARLNRPDARNALSTEVMERLASLVEEWDADEETRCIVIAGSNDYFAAGADIKAMRDRSFQEAMANPTSSYWARIAGCRTPMIAAVSGFALGGGCELALSCDMIVASPSAEFGQPEITLGIIPGAGGTQRLTRVVGKQRAMEIVLTGRRINVDEAHAMGLVNRVSKKWFDDAVELAQVVARRPPIAARLGKQAVQAADETALAAGLAYERRLYELAMATEDRLEGMSAFIEKRRPEFRGAELQLGVAGAGTMGAGIAQLGCQAGMRTLLYDPLPEARERGAESIKKRLGDVPTLVVVDDLDELAACDLVIEAVPERPELKRQLFEELSLRNPDAVLATNTSSILVTSLAGAAQRPENVVGMHFFNPPPVMKLVEIIRAEQTGDEAVALATRVAREMEREPIEVVDGPGFLVNRCNRPFGAEALRLLQERVATAEQIDRIVRLGGGFRMGPFELMDLVGIDVGFEVAKSFMEQSFGEPRWKPSPLQAKKVAAGKLGRKTGSGWYEYPPGRPEDPEPLESGGGEGRRIRVVGEGRLWDELRERARQAGFDEGDDLVIGEDVVLRAGQPADGKVGFHLLPPLGRLVELTGERSEEVERVFAALGFHHEWVADAPGLVLGRIASQLVNEAAFAIGEGVGSPEDVDAGMKLGLNHPRGPVEWWRAIGTEHVVSVLDALAEDRYRVAPLLRRGSIE